MPSLQYCVSPSPLLDCRSIRAKHFLIDESGVVKLSGLRSMVSLIQGGTRKKVSWCTVSQAYNPIEPHY